MMICRPEDTTTIKEDKLFDWGIYMLLTADKLNEAIFRTEELMAEPGNLKYPDEFFYNRENARNYLVHILVDQYKRDEKKLYFTEDGCRTYLLEMKDDFPCDKDECVGVIHYIIMKDSKE